ncbi:MAG TPA: hypothetical protein VGS10_17445 [Terracidiphilus sp.]|nr:hypothetical protein [Terracidiphilus sp.]
MRRVVSLLALLAGMILPPLFAQDAGLTVPATIQAGSVLSVTSAGSGNGTLFIIGPDKVWKKQIEVGGTVQLPAGTLVQAGHYLAVLSSGTGRQSASFDVLPMGTPAKVSFIAEPSRLPVDLHNGVTGTVYVFDQYGNLVVRPTPVSFQLSTPSGPAQTNSIATRDGAAWTWMNTTAHEGQDRFEARVGGVTSLRIVQQVAGDPCQISMSVQPSGQNLQLQTAPVRDCSGNPVPDGTIVTFSESYKGGLSTADVPLKHGMAKADLPAHPGSVLSVASGVVLGNQIRWSK